MEEGKFTKDGKRVPSRCWYYLLAWNDEDKWNTLHELYNCKRLGDLTEKEFYNLLVVAATADAKEK